MTISYVRSVQIVIDARRQRSELERHAVRADASLVTALDPR